MSTDLVKEIIKKIVATKATMVELTIAAERKRKVSEPKFVQAINSTKQV